MAENRFSQFRSQSTGGGNRFAQYAQPAPAPSALEYVQGAAGGFNTGLAAVAGLPVDAVNAGLNLIGLGTERPFGGSRSIMDGMEGARDIAATVGNQVSPGTFTDNPEPMAAGSMSDKGPDTPGGRLVNRVGQEVGATALPAAGILRAAQGVPKAVQAAPSLSQAFLDPIRRAPGRAAVGETAAAVGAGAGATIMREAYPDSDVAEQLGQIVGGFAPTAIAHTPVALAGRAVNGIRSRFSSEAQREGARNVVRDFMGEQLTTGAREALGDADRLAKEIPGFDPSLAERTGSPGLVRKQEDIEGRMAGTELDAAVARRLANDEAVERYGANAAPQADGTPEIIVDAAQGRVTRLRDSIEGAQASADAGRMEVAGRAPPADRSGKGVAIREAIAAERASTREEMTSLANSLGINDADVTVDFTRAARSIAEEFSPGSIFEDLKNYPEVIDVIRRAGSAERVTFSDLKTLRERVSDDLIDALGAANPSRQRVRQLTALKGRVDGVIDDLTRSADPTLADRYRQFRDTYFRDYVDRFEKGVVFRMTQRDGRGFYRTPDEEVAERFFQAGEVSSARQFKAVLGGNAEANAALEAVALDSLNRAAVRNGVVDPRLADTWLRNHRSVLDEFPDMTAKIKDIAGANSALVNRQAALTRRARAIENSLLAKELRAVDSDMRDAGDMIQRALASPRKMAAVRRAVGDNDEARAALRRAVWDGVADKGPGEIGAFIDANRQTLRTAGLDDAHLDALRNIDAARIVGSRVRMPQGSADIPTDADAFLRTFGVRPDMLANRLRELHTGRSEKAYTITNLLSNIFARKQRQNVDEAFKAALYDREIAREMAEALTMGKLSNEAATRLQARFFALGIPLFEEGEDEAPIDGLPVSPPPSSRDAIDGAFRATGIEMEQ